jgi:hypothetical protein
VAGWVHGTLDNNGISLQALNNTDDDTVWFVSSDDATAANRPRLVVLYVPPDGTPTPTPTVPAESMTVVLQEGLDGYAGVSDTRLEAGSPGSNFASSELRVGDAEGAATLIKFDLSSIPPGASVQSAQLQVYGYGFEGGGSLEVSAFAVRRPWSETAATWTLEMPSIPWAVPGCDNPFSDRAELPTDQQSHSAVGWQSWVVGPDVQRMVREPGTNEGWLLRQTLGGDARLSMYSSEHDNAEYRPLLVVTYSVP